MEVQRMRTFVNFQPGERRSCIGCHEHAEPGPAESPAAVALRQPPATLDAAARRDCAPARCTMPPTCSRFSTAIACRATMRSGPTAALDLSGEMTTLFCRSYENIIHKDLVGYIQEFVGPEARGRRRAWAMPPAAPPYTYGSHQSKLIAVLRKRPLRREAAARGFHSPGDLGRCQRALLRLLFRAAEHHLPRPARFPPRAHARIGLGHSPAPRFQPIGHAPCAVR